MSEMSLFAECEHYILNIPRFSTEKNSLEKLRTFLTRLGEPQKGKKIIHVAGTNGKGSVCAYLSSILTASGIKTGLFTSPHLVSMRERIKINDKMVSEDNFLYAFHTIKDNITDFHPTFFEFLFLMAMVIFDKNGVECLVLETGLGGRLDATNALLEKDLTIITPISYDHMEHLGNTLTEIAGEKAGIMRQGIPLITSPQEPEVADFLRKIAIENNSKFEQIKNSAIKINKLALKTIDFSYQYRYDVIVRIILSTKALYQIQNASLAIHSALIFNDERISVDTITAGLTKTVWLGRMEEIENGIIIDGAHNEAGIAAFIESARAISANGKRFLLFAGMREKQSDKIISILKKDGFFDEIIACPLANPRSLTIEDLLVFFPTESVFDDVKSGIDYLQKKKQSQDLIFVTGSLYLYNEVKRNTDD